MLDFNLYLLYIPCCLAFSCLDLPPKIIPDLFQKVLASYCPFVVYLGVKGDKIFKTS